MITQPHEEFTGLRATKTYSETLTPGPQLVTSEAAEVLVTKIMKYRIPVQRRVVLILECSGTKPWTFCYTRRILSGLLRGMEWPNKVEILTVSSMLGIVPSSFEQEFPAASYDWNIEREVESPTLEDAIKINRMRVHEFFCAQSSLGFKTCIAATHGRYSAMLGNIGKLFHDYTDVGWTDSRDYRSVDILRVHSKLVEALTPNPTLVSSVNTTSKAPKDE